MHVLRKIALGISVVLFGPVMVLLAVSFAFSHTAGQAEFVKQTFREAKLYSTLSDLATNEFRLEGEPQSDLIVEALKETITPEVIQTAFEQVIDDVYVWMDEGKDKLEFSIDLRPIKQGFMDKLHQKLVVRAQSLPPCTYSNPPASTDILELTCLPPGTDVNSAVDQAINELMASGEILQKDELTAENLGNSVPADTNEEPTTDTNPNATNSTEIKGGGLDQDSLNRLAGMYRLVKKSFPYLAVSAAVLAVGIFFLSKTRLRGVRKISALLLANGALLFVLAIIIQTLAKSLAPEAADIKDLSSSAEFTARIIVEAYSILTRNFGIVFMVTGLAGVIASSIAISKLEPKSPKAEEVHKELKDKHLPQTKAADTPEDK